MTKEAGDLYAKVMVDTPGLGLLDYAVPADMLVAVGDRVVVGLRTRNVVGIVAGLRAAADFAENRVRQIKAVLRDSAPMTEEWLALTRFAAGYYIRSWGEAAVPTLPVFFRRIPGVRHQNQLEKLKKLPEPAGEAGPKPALNDEQSAAVEAVSTASGYSPFLLFGVTGSGKTEVYLHIMERVLARDPEAQVLLLVPEINLTPQLEGRVRSRFPGESVVTLNSDLADMERARSWLAVHEGRARVLVGTRMSVFSSFRKLSLVIVDEEHETSYKQQDPAPRYNARDAALILASMHGAKTLLGSATPSIQTYYKAESGKYGLVNLSTRFEGVELPAVRVIDTKQSRKRKEMRGAFTKELVNECNDAIARGEQAIIFQNRRGFAPMVRCKECAWIPKCENCDVSLTYHKYINLLSCHYCGYTMPLPNICPACGQPTIEVVGYGTERIEDDIEKYFPEAKIARMDLDTTRSKTGYEKIIDSFSNRRTQILVGTQMVTKGLDFEGVSVVGIINADTMINLPDFRSHERAFNMMEQVAGRAGRRQKQGIVCIQTSAPENPVIKFVVDHDYKGFYRSELEERRRFNYPPFTRIINIYIKHRDDNSLTEMSVRFSNMLRQVFGKRVLGPEPPTVARVQQLYIRQIVLKMETTASMSKVKQILRTIYEQSLSDPRMKSAIVYYDVDPS